MCSISRIEYVSKGSENQARITSFLQLIATARATALGYYCKYNYSN